MIDRKGLLVWLKRIDSKLTKQIIVIAVGGTAMTLLNLKESTLDIDFCVNSYDRKDFQKALDKKFRVDLFVDGYIFSEQLPVDYIEKSSEILKLKNLTLKALHPLDLIITKVARFNARDEEDIAVLAKYVESEELLQRFEKVVETYAGNENDYRENFSVVLKRFFL